MTAKNECLLGIALWAVGVIGCILAVYFVTRHLAEVLTIFGGLTAIGLCLIGGGALDWLVDDFHDDIKKEWEDGHKGEGDTARKH